MASTADSTASPTTRGGGAGGGAGAADGSSAAVAADDVEELSVETLTSVTGEENLDNVTDFEAIFTRIDRIANLHHTPNLKSFTLIDTNLQRISHLSPVSRSLVRLCLTEQRITRIEGLDLPLLRDLQLHNNQIAKIEGLGGCPRLQRLWLFGNKISTIEGLEGVCDLRELWLQENKISHIQNVAHLVNLQVFSLGANRISDFADLSELQSLPALRSFALNDVHFGPCPVTQLDGYRHYVLCQLRQITELDGHEVSPRDRKAAYDGYLQQTLEFSKKVDDLMSDTNQELRAIEARRQRNWLNSGALRGELLATFGELEAVVRDGRAAVLAEQTRQQHVRESNLRALTAKLDDIRREQSQWIDERLSKEKKAMELEEEAFAQLIARAEVETDTAAHMANLTYRSRGAIVCQDLSEHSPDYRFVSSHLHDCMQHQPTVTSTGSTRKRRPMRLLKAYKVFHRALERRFVTAGDSTETLRLFYGGEQRALREVLEKGFVDTGDDAAEEPLVLFADPWHAAARACDREPWKERTGGAIHGLLMCRVCPGNTLRLPGASRKLPDDDTIDQVAARIPSGYSAACVTNEEGRGDESDGEAPDVTTRCYVLKPAQADRVLPEFFLLCSEVGRRDVVSELGASSNAARGIDFSEATLEAALADLVQPVSANGGAATAAVSAIDAEGAAQLSAFQSKVEEAVAQHEGRVWREMDPETAVQLADAENEVRRLTNHLNSLRQEIDQEKSEQERILREFRMQVGGKSTRKVRH